MNILDFDTSEQVLIVAEIGNNHEGDFDVAAKLVNEAAACGVDAVKFQLIRAEHLVDKSDMARFNQLKSFELGFEQFEQLSKLAHSLGLLFFCTPFDLTNVGFLEAIVDGYKIASGDNTFYPLIERVALTGKPLIISTGLSDFQQVRQSVVFVEQQWAAEGIQGELAVLHCVSSYPTLSEQANLRSIQFLAENLDCAVGYSDHTLGIDAAVLAVALGALIVEKHFTLDKHFSDFRDHQLSADPSEMRELVTRIRMASAMLGSFSKMVQPAEELAVRALRRSIVAGRDLLKGHRIMWSDLTWVRPAGGLAPGEEQKLLGKALRLDVRFGEQLYMKDVE
jgi:sialic acid synthase SpsE